MVRSGFAPPSVSGRQSMQRALNITLNGNPHACAQETANVADLVRELALEGKRIAIERNGEIVPRSRYPLTLLAPGDCFEVVVAVGGG